MVNDVLFMKLLRRKEDYLSNANELERCRTKTVGPFDDIFDLLAKQMLAERALKRDTAVAWIGFKAVHDSVLHHSAARIDQIDD